MKLKDAFSRLSPRERSLVTLLGVVFAVLFAAGLPIGLQFIVSARRDENDDLRKAIAAVQGARSAVRERLAKRDAIVQRYQRRAPPLAGHIEQLARAEKLEVIDSNDRPEVPHGKRYVERATEIHLKKAGLLPIAKFFEALESGGMAVSISRLNMRKRPGEANSYDVLMGLSAFDRNEAPAQPQAGEGEKGTP